MNFRKFYFLAVVFFLDAGLSAGVGLTVKFSSVQIENLLPGETYNTREIVNLPFTVINTGQEDAIGSMTVIIPKKQECKKNFEPIEDITWVQLSDNVIDIRPGAAKVVDIIIRVPDKPVYYDRKFEAHIESIARAKKGNVATGVLSRIYFTTVPTLEEKERREKQKREKEKLLSNLNFEFLPGKVLLFEIKPGKRYDVSEKSGKILKIVNMNDEKYKYKLTSVSTEEANQSAASGYEPTPDPGWLTFEKNIFALDENTILPVKVFLEIPKDKKYYGKKYQFFIRVDLLEQKIPVSIYSYVMVQMAEK